MRVTQRGPQDLPQCHPQGVVRSFQQVSSEGQIGASREEIEAATVKAIAQQAELDVGGRKHGEFCTHLVHFLHSFREQRPGEIPSHRMVYWGPKNADPRPRFERDD